MINLTITDKEVKATEAIKEYVEKKIQKIEKYFGNEATIDANLKIDVVKNYQVAEIYITAEGTSYKAVTEDKDLYASIDKDIDILEGQIRENKTKKEKAQKEASIKQMSFNGAEVVQVEDEGVKTLYYELKPMSVEDAKLKLQEKPTNQFLVYVDIDTQKVNVLFKLKDGKNYGIVEPEA